MLDARKITRYLLSHADEKRSAKARFFESLGFSLEVSERLRGALLDHPARNEVAAVEDTDYGPKFIISCQLTTPDGRNPCITTVWMADVALRSFRFVTAVPRAAKSAQ